MARPIPSEADWNSGPWNIDVPYARKHFAGKSLDEAVALFKDNALVYQEDVMFMPSACFPFYCEAYIAYLMSEDSKGDVDGASCFFDLVKIRAVEVVRDQELMSAASRTLQHLAERQSWYDDFLSEDGCFAEDAENALQKLYAAKSNC